MEKPSITSRNSPTFLSIINFLPDATFAVDLNGRVIAWNRSIEEMTGVKAIDIIGKGDYGYALPFYGIRRPLLIDLVLNPDEDMGKHYFPISRDGDVLYCKTRVPLHGKHRFFDVKAGPLYDREGGIAGAIESLRDITEQERRDWENIFQTVGQPTVIIDPNHTIIAANRAVVRASGVSEEDIVGRKCYEVFHGKDFTSPLESCPMERLVALGHLATVEMEEEVLGGVYLVSCTPIFSEQGHIEKVIHVATDITERKRAEEALTRSEEKFSKAFRSSPDPIAISRLSNGCLIDVNSSLERMFGYRRDELIGRTVGELNIWVDPEDRMRLLQRLLTEGSVIDQETRYRARDGRTLTTRYSAEIVEIEGEPCILATLMDMSERIRIEDELRESKQQLADIVNFLPDATLVIDREGKVISWNRAIEEMTGIKAADILGKGDYEYALPFYNERRPILIDFVLKPDEAMETIYDGVYRKDMVITGEAYMHTLKGGKTYLLGKASVLHDSKGNVVGAIESIRDITKRRIAEEAVIRAEETYRGIFENAVMGIFRSTPEGRIISANQAFARIFGYDSPEEVIDTVTDLSRQVYLDPERRIELLRLVEKQGIVQEFEVQFFRKDRSIAWITLNLRAFFESSGKLLYYEGTAQDISDRKLLEAQLRQAQKMEAIGTLAGGIAHDFNNILSAIMGYADMALADHKENDRLRRYLEQVFKGGERARDLVKQILAFSRQNEEKPRPLRISPVIREVLKLLKASLPSTIQIVEDIRSDKDTVLSDPTHIYQILMNLCTNASYAMRKGKGELKVSLFPAEIKPRDMLTVHHGLTPGMYVKLTVSDSGHGIEPMIMERIFDPFFTTKNPGEGTGLGLSVVYGIVKSYGGTITVRSEVGQGTEFSIYLPLLMEMEGTQESRDEAPAPRGKERILYVDDEEVLVNLGKEMLTSLGYRVIGRTSSLEALELFRSRPERFDLVVTDMTMPNMTGIELAQEIMRIIPDMPVILCTGFSEAITPERAAAVGLTDFIMKPVIKNQIASVIRRVLDLKE